MQSYGIVLSRYVCLLGFVLASCSNTWAQGVALSLSSGSGSPGQPVVLNLSLNASSTLPDSTEWTLNYSPTDFSSVTLAPAAGSTNKTLSCTNGTGTATCLVWGLNSQTIPNNVLATVTLTVAGSTSDSSSTVQLGNSLSASSSGAAIPTTATGGIVSISQTPVLNRLSCSPASITPAAGSTCTVGLSSAALSGGATIGISASPAAANVPSTVTINQGSTSTTFSVTAGTVSTATPVTLTASYSGANLTYGITVNPPPPALSSLAVAPSTITSGLSGTGTVTLTEAAGSGGIAVSLASSNTAVASVPASVTVAQNATSATFQVNTGSVSSSTSATLTASYSGVNATFGVTVNPLPGALSSVSVSPSAITSGQSGSGTVSLTAPAGTGGATITLSSSNAAVASVPSSVTIPQGSTATTFAVSTGSVSVSTTATVAAYYSGVNTSFLVTVNPPPAALSGVSVSPSAITSGQSGTGSVSLTAPAGTGGAMVALASSNTAVATVPASVMVPQGSSSVTFPVATGAVSSSSSAMVTASYAGANASFPVTVNPPVAALSSLSVTPSAIFSGGQSGLGTVTLTAPAGASGVIVTLATSNTSAVRIPSKITIQPGASSAIFTASAGPVSVSTVVTLTASYNSATTSFPLTVSPASTATSTAGATFQGLDTTTQGNWRNTYSYPNVTIIGGGTVNKTTTPVPSGQSLYIWTTNTTDVRALENLSSTGRIAGRWAAANSFTVDLNFTDELTHQVAIYCLDWNQGSRVETISVLNAATNAVLDTRTVSDFANGVYAVWTVTGHVKLQITKNSGANAVISGVFLK